MKTYYNHECNLKEIYLNICLLYLIITKILILILNSTLFTTTISKLTLSNFYDTIKLMLYS